MSQTLRINLENETDIANAQAVAKFCEDMTVVAEFATGESFIVKKDGTLTPMTTTPAQKPKATKPKAKATPTKKPKRKAKAKKTKQDKYAPAGFHYLSKVKLREAKIAGHIPWLVTVNEAIAKYGMTTDFTPHAPAKVGTTKMSKRDADDLARLKRKGLV